MAVKVAYEVQTGTVNAATSAVLINGGSAWTVFIRMLRTGFLYPMALARDAFRSGDGSYPRTGAVIRGDLDTAVAAELSGWTGDGVTFTFTGQATNNTPVIPFSLDVYYPCEAAGHAVKHLYDKFGNGILYGELTATTYSSEVAMGTINYATGAVTLAVTNDPGWIPQNGQAIRFNYNYCTQLLGSAAMAGHQRAYPYTAGSYSQQVDFRFIATAAGTLAQIEIAIDMNK